MDLIMPQVFDRIKAASGELVRCKRFPLGVWNMDANDYRLVAWSMPDLSKILSVEVLIISDDGNQLAPLCGTTDYGTGKTNGGIGAIHTNNLSVYRTVGGIFDNTAYDDAVMNRGYIFVWYIE